MKLPTLVLDLDDSIRRLPNENRLRPATHWREQVRFGCSIKHVRQFWAETEKTLPPTEQYGTVLIGSGDFHHLTLPLVQHCLKNKTGSMRLIVLDNHPDNMRFPWGIHCGAWVRHAALLPQISHIHVVGVTSQDISVKHAWENYLAPLFRGRVTYWSTGVNVGWGKNIGIGKAFQHFNSSETLCEAFCSMLAQQPEPTYLSIDKDVFSPSVVRTNWDQGQMTIPEALRIIKALSGSLVGSDITGEVSEWQYQTAWKRWLSAADGQQLIFGATLNELHNEHATLNLQLLEALAFSRKV
ncbi:hypothetical protein [Serratia marcescens]|uniref:hypothetical protein n=1 Tax=Serratia marcescens TaxID=615 RepID=UPI002FD8D2D1